jgi:shikimate kinase
VIVGLMGIGKTTAADALAAKLGRPLSDSDREIEQLVGIDGRLVAADLGVPALHQLERAALIAALARPEPHIITAAASVVEDELIRSLLGNATVVHLDVDDDELATVHQRQAEGDHRRAMPLEELRNLAARRAPLFARVADLRIDATSEPDTIVAAVLDHLGHTSL